MKLEFKLGDVFNIIKDNQEVTVKVYKGTNCSNCIFNNIDDCDFICCCQEDRLDGTGVYFKEIDKENKDVK